MDFKTDLVEPFALPQTDGQHHLSLLGELECVGQEVVQDLGQTHAVGHDRRLGKIFRPHRHKLHIRVGHHLERRHQLVEELLQRNGLEVKVQLAGADLGKVKDVVDEGEQLFGRGVEGMHQLLPLAVVLVRFQHVADRNQRVQRRPNLVGHGAQELVLGLQRLLQLLSALNDLGFHLVGQLVVLLTLHMEVVAKLPQRLGENAHFVERADLFDVHIVVAVAHLVGHLGNLQQGARDVKGQIIKQRHRPHEQQNLKHNERLAQT